MPVLALTLTLALVPSLLLMWYFHSRDVYPEPPRVLWATFGLGVASIIPTLIFALPTIFLIRGIASPLASGLGSAFLSAAIPEEFFKFLVLYAYCIRHREFNEPMDGVVYGVAASLGFATLENVMYVSTGGLGIAILRAFTAVPMHAFCGAIMGCYVGRGAFAATGRGELFFRGWAVAALLHGLYDFPLLTLDAISRQLQGRPPDGGTAMLGLGLMGGALAVLVVMAIWAVRATRSLRRDQEALPRRPVPVPASAAGTPLSLGFDTEWTAVPPPVPFAPAPTRVPAAPRGVNVGAVLLLVSGGLIACAGGLVVALIALGLAFGHRDVDIGSVVGGTCIIGVFPLIVGAVMFALGIRWLNAE